MRKFFKFLKRKFRSSTPKRSKEDIWLEELKHTLLQEGLSEEEIIFVLKNGERFFNHPDCLAERLQIELSLAENVLNELRIYKNKNISHEEMKRFEELIMMYPNEDPLRIALLNDIEESIAIAYLELTELIPLTDVQKVIVMEKFTKGFSISEIADLSGLSLMKIQDFIEAELISFMGEEGQRVLEIISKHFGDYPIMKLRDLIITKNAKLQDQICYELLDINELEYNELKSYFMKFEESRTFFEIDETLSLETKEIIRRSTLDDIQELSVKLNISQRVIKAYLLQYYADESLMLYSNEEQKRMIHKLVGTFGLKELISHSTYRTIISESFDELIANAKELKDEPNMILKELLPIAFYYLKCSLPLKEFSQIVSKIINISLTTLDLFHLIFQMSDPIVRGLCIEHYSFSNPVPFYYPKLEPSNDQDQTFYQFEICKELWYSGQQFNGIVSFGLGWASWNPIGKSHLLDLMFETDFVKGSPQNSPFHRNSIDIQLTKNLYGNKQKNLKELTQWAYIDCHGYSDYDVITYLCQSLDIILVHVIYFDFQEYYSRIEDDLWKMTCGAQRIYVLIRDYPEDRIKTEENTMMGKFYKFVFIPHVIKNDHNVDTDLKALGYEILHSIHGNIKLFDSIFLENMLLNFEPGNFLGKQTGLIESILNHIYPNECIDYSSLSYYSYFIEFMSCYYKSCRETDQKAINEQNENCKKLDKELNEAKMSRIVRYFNEIICQENSTLILWKLAQDLKNIPDRFKDCTQKFSLEILWREALLTKKYNKGNDAFKFAQEFAQNFSKHVERGEPFELIDGDNLRYFNQDINGLLSDLYWRQSSIGMNNPPPIVISIFGPQSSGKSTLLNYCFGCKFLTSAGRCTKGVYASLSKLSQPINNSDHFLILDTEGLDSIEKGKVLSETSCIQFDRTMVLFCLAVSQVVIINVKGDFGEEMRNLLQICGYSLQKLKVTKAPPPKIFFVLNQQADPDPEKHLSSINTLLEDLNRGSFLMETEGIKISDLIQVSKENLFVLPSAFNSVSVNAQMAKLFDSDLYKLSPTVSFANKCADLKMSIIRQLQNDIILLVHAPFTSMSEWMEMSGVIWDTIVKYQDIVKYRNLDELKSTHLLEEIVSTLLKNHIYQFKNEYIQITERLIKFINEEITLWSPFNGVLQEVKGDLENIFKEKKEEALVEFERMCESNSLLRKMAYMCDNAKSNLCRLINIEAKNHEDKLRFEIKARLIELKLSENMMRFQRYIDKNADKYFELSIEEQTSEFGRVWQDCFGTDFKTDEEHEINEIFDKMYSIFSIESKSMEGKSIIYTLFHDLKFNMDQIIPMIRNSILSEFCNEPDMSSGSEKFLYPFKENKPPLKEMTPYPGKENCEYLSKDILASLDTGEDSHNTTTSLFKGFYSGCKAIIQQFSGNYNDPDIRWKTDKKQILLLASKLRDPNDHERSTWEKFIDDITNGVTELIENDLNILHSTIKEVVHLLCEICKVVNYELNFIEARLTNTAERKLTTYAFSLVFKSFLNSELEKQLQRNAETEKKKESDLSYFLQKIENRKLARGNWDRQAMRKGDATIANKFAGDLLKSILRSVYTECERNLREEYFDGRVDSLSHKSLLLFANNRLSQELESGYWDEIPIFTDNFVVQFICNRNQTLKYLFQKRWMEVAGEIHGAIIKKMKERFFALKSYVETILTEFLNDMLKECEKLDRAEEIGLDSDSNFVVFNSFEEESAYSSDPQYKEAPFKAMVLFLEMYLNPNVSPDEFNQFFNEPFEVDGVLMEKNPDTYVLCEKTSCNLQILDELFKKLSEIKMFSNTETIFNIRIYIEEFLRTLTSYSFEISQNDYENLLRSTKEEFESRVINCPNQCPSCGKFCEREIHPNDGKCRTLTGHQICSMGGKVWNTNKYQTAILLMCEDYRDESTVLIPGQRIKWWEFKEKCGDQWDWTLPQDGIFVNLQQENRVKILEIWRIFGRAILQHHADEGTNIKYIPYTSLEEIYQSLFTLNSFVCFVIDATELMGHSFEYAKHWVSEHMSGLEGVSSFRVVIYHGHCLENNFIESFPEDSNFTSDKNSVLDFLDDITIYGDQNDEYALLHGLAAAFRDSNWKSGIEIRNILVHTFIEPTTGYYKPFKAKGECPHGCSFNWEKDIRSRNKELNIKYKRDRILGCDHPDHGSAETISYDDKAVDLSSEMNFKSEVFINYESNC